MQETKTRGVIDTLAEGFRLLNRRPWLLGIPIVLDLFLWLGPHLTVQALATRLNVQNPDLEGLAAALAEVNVLGLLAWRFGSAIGPARLGEAGSFDLGSVAGLALVIAGLLAVGLALFSVFYAAVVEAAQGRRLSLPELGRRAGRGFLSLSAFWLPLLLLTGVLAATIAGLAATGPAGQAVAGVVVLFAAAGALMLWVFLYLVQPAVFAARLSAPAAVAESVRVVKANLGATIRLFALVMVITFGTGLVWQGFDGSGVGVLVAIVGNAYVVTGLTVAVPLFYIDRRTGTRRLTTPAAQI